MAPVANGGQSPPYNWPDMRNMAALRLAMAPVMGRVAKGGQSLTHD
jgi:hypothetical protein